MMPVSQESIVLGQQVHQAGLVPLTTCGLLSLASYKPNKPVPNVVQPQWASLNPFVTLYRLDSAGGS
jgi:hypothetical protein